MSRFIESIRLNDGVFERLSYHQERVNNAFKVAFPELTPLVLQDVLSAQHYPEKGIYKCRIEFDSSSFQIEFQPYTMRKIESLRLVNIEMSSANYKSAERMKINKAFEKRDGCDDVLLVRDGLITDTSYSNVAFFDGESWYTPRIPLIYGTRRAFLIAENQIRESEIRLEDLHQYQRIRLFNAMIGFGQQEMPVSAIISAE